MTQSSPTLNYTTYGAQLANFFPISTGDVNFATFLPGNIDYAEQRIYRDLNLLTTKVVDATTQVSSASRIFTLPTGIGTFITVDRVNAITSAGQVSSLGARVPLMPVSPEFIDITYPSATQNNGTPRFYARQNDTQLILGPPPDAPYYLEIVGVQRPAPLSSANSSTILTQYLPDLFMAAALVHAYGYMKDFGATTDNPAAAISWEAQYKTLLQSAQVEQFRQKFHSEAWTSEQPSPVATPPRM